MKPTKHTRKTGLGHVVPMEDDFLFVAKDGKTVHRLVGSWKGGFYDLLSPHWANGKGKQLTPAAARKLFAKQWDIYQRVIT